MSFATDKLYKGYLRRRMAFIVSNVNVREIVTHLPCLTDHDRENIEAKRETCGNYDSMVLLLDCLKRRENWPEQFIDALEACEHTTIAAEIRAEYNALRGTDNSNPSSPSTTVVRAHVHPSPSASHVSVPQSAGTSQAAVAPPAAQASPPLEIPVQPLAPQSSAAQVPEAVSPPEPPQSAQVEVAPLPSTPPPSPETPHTQAATTPPPQRVINSHQEPVENSESDIQDISGDNGSAGNSEVSINAVATPRPVGPCETATPSRPDPKTITTEVRPPQSSSPTQVNSDVADGSSVPLMTPEKPPVQDTTPPVDKKSATQVVDSSPQTETAAATFPLHGAAGMDAPLFDDTLSLSKPGQLISIHPQNHSSPTIPAPRVPVEPYSGNSERLEISEAAVTSACSAASSTTVNTASALPCQENGITPIYNEPEENQYDSPCQSVGNEEVLEYVGHVSEEPSILDQDGQSFALQAQIISGEAAKKVTSAPLLSASAANTVSRAYTPSSENHHPSEPAPADSSPEEKTASHTLSANTKYILTAAGVGAFALLMAWKFKN